MTIRTLYDAGAVKRFHAVRTINDTTVGHHSWGVAMIILNICQPSVELLKAAIYHDAAEVLTGDVPYPAKQRYPRLKEVLDSIEHKFELEQCIVTELSGVERRILKWSDMCELLLLSLIEIEMGNSRMSLVRDNALDALDRMGYPSGASRELMKDIIEEYNL